MFLLGSAGLEEEAWTRELVHMWVQVVTSAMEEKHGVLQEQSTGGLQAKGVREALPKNAPFKLHWRACRHCPGGVEEGRFHHRDRGSELKKG